MTINNQAFILAGVTVDEYVAWCKENNKPKYKKTTKAEFFAKLKSKKLYRDSSGKLVVKTKK